VIVVMIVPTGVGAAIGGDAGDATPAAKLLASCCDTLITHPNVVNASDINEMTPNTWYVEGSMLDEFLCDKIALRGPTQPNKILVVGNSPFSGETFNAASAARATIGARVELLELTRPLTMRATFDDRGRATGEIVGLRSAIEDIRARDFDVVAVHTPIDCDRETALRWYREGGINPWGGVEAKLSRLMSKELGRPVAHAPLENVDPAQDEELFFIYRDHIRARAAAEAVSVCYLHCVLKGLHLAPLVAVDQSRGMTVQDVTFMVSPRGCWGPPHDACEAAGVPIVFVRENCVAAPADDWQEHMNKGFMVENYLEAAGLIMAARAGVTPESVRANFPDTTLKTKGV
jgi:hypothetical protein